MSMALLHYVLLMQFAVQIWSMNFKVALIIEDAVVNRSLVEKAFNNRVRSNWRVLQGHTVSYVQINATSCSLTQITRSLCNETGLSGVIAVGKCNMLSQIGLATRTMQLPLVSIPIGICDYATSPIGDFSVVAMPTTWDMTNAAVETMLAASAKQVAVFFDSKQSSMVLQDLQDSLSKRGISSLTFQVDSNNGTLLVNLATHLTRLVKKKVHHMVILAEAANVFAILDHANTSLVLQQNYFWLVIDSGIAKGQLKARILSNSNVALLRGGTTGLNTPATCSAPVQDVFDSCDTDWIRTLDARFVDGVEALAKALNDSVNGVAFTPSNATCSPLQAWNSGPAVYANLINMTNYDTKRGVISFNSSSGHFNSQGIEVVASYNPTKFSPLQYVLSGHYNTLTGAMVVQHRERGVSHIFPNTFTGFRNETIIVCSPELPPFTTLTVVFASNNTVKVGGMLKNVLDILAERMEFRYITKSPDDGKWGGPQPGLSYFTGCVGEVQRGLVQIGGGTFTKTATRDAVIDFSSDLFQEANAVLIPRPPPKSKLWNVYKPFHYYVWMLIVAFLFISSIGTWILAYFSPFTAYNLELEFAIADEIWLQEYLWGVVGSFLQQGQDFYPFAMSPRTLMAFWWMFTVIIYGAYTGDLTAHLTISITDLPIKTLDDLVSQSAIKPLVTEGTNIDTLLRSATGGVYKEIANRMLVETHVPNCLSRVFTENVACITDYTTLLYLSRANCSQVYLAQELFNTATVSFMYAEDAYFSALWDFNMKKMQENGVMQKLFNTHWSSDAVCSTGSSADADSIDLEGTGGCFIVTLACYLLGLVMLCSELVWTKALKKDPLNCLIY